MTWLGPPLDADQRDLVAMLDALTTARDVVLTDDPQLVGRIVAELAGLGVWTLGTAESSGGGGADRLTTAVALERLGRVWPALGWASVQAHATVDLLAGDKRFDQLVARVHQGTHAVAVVDARSPAVHLEWQDGVLVGAIDRVDVAVEAPHVLVLDNDEAALIPSASMSSMALQRTGLGGGCTRSLEVHAAHHAVQQLHGVDASAARTRLFLGAASVAAGIAGAAADDALQYAKDRHQFGGPLTTIPTVRKSLLKQMTLSAVALTAAMSMADGVGPALAAARQACGHAIQVTAEALQTHGGYGYLTEYPAEQRLRDAISLRATADLDTASLRGARILVGLSTSGSQWNDVP